MDYYNRIVKACIYGDTIYVANSQNKVYAYDVKKKKVLGTFDMNGTDIHALYQIGNATYVRYEQDGNPANGSEPIEWIVLANDGHRLFILSKYILEA